ncbi:unnamed protein product [Chrysoparadoxa australica]
MLVINTSGMSALSFSSTAKVREILTLGLRRELQMLMQVQGEADKPRLGSLMSVLAEAELMEDDKAPQQLDMRTCAHMAAIAGLPEVLNMLVKQDFGPGTSSRWKDVNGWTPLHHCAASSSNAHRECAVILLGSVRGGGGIGDLTHSGKSALHLACGGASGDEKSRTAMISLLIQHGASVNQVDGSGLQPLHAAAMAGSPMLDISLSPSH